MEDGIPCRAVYIVQARLDTYAWSCFRFAALYLYPILGTMERDHVGNLSPRDQMEIAGGTPYIIEAQMKADEVITI